MIRFVAVLALSVCALSAQTQRASISGEVTDSLGAVAVGAKVTATNAETNAVETAITNASGIYVIPNLEIGRYSVTVEHSGFRRYHETGIAVRAG